MRILVSLSESKPLSKAAQAGVAILKAARLYTAAKQGSIKKIYLKEFGSIKKATIEYENKKRGNSITTVSLGLQDLPAGMSASTAVSSLKAAISAIK